MTEPPSTAAPSPAAGLGPLVAEIARRQGPAVDLIAAVADALPSQRRTTWRQVAACIARGDTSGLTTLAGRDASWIVPLLAHAPDDPRLPAALAAAAAPPPPATASWSMLGYPLLMAGIILLVLHFLAVTVLPEFEAMFADFDLELPVLTRAVLGLGTLARSGALLVIAGLLAAAGLGLVFVRPRRGAAVAAAYSRALATLRGAGLDPATALPAAALALHLRPALQPSRGGPLSIAAVAAVSLEPPAADIVLRAIADCQADRAQGRAVGLLAALAPVAVVGIGLLVGIVVLALFMPLIRLVNGLS